MCDKLEFDDKGEFTLHALAHIVETNRNILHNHNDVDGYILGFKQACRDQNLTDKEIEKLLPRAKYLVEVNIKK